ncbi:uncharacterized protein [Haliotis cracherodii]|uniref:uncharacterized protein n=1 Tax=Haliotis cracherodii TaxID=6455 RepID=UPI0039E8780D
MIFPQAVFVIVSLIQGIVCPGPPGHEVSCYHCEHKDHFPDCLNRPHVCHPDEVCEILYGGIETIVRCAKAHDCQHDIDKAKVHCGIGGSQTDHGCEICCHDDACVSEQVAAMQGLPLASTPTTALMSCPGHCRPDNVDTCLVNAHMCSSGEFCQLEAEHGELRGHCTRDIDLRACLATSYDENTAVCSEGDLSLVQEHHRCTYCCLDSNCGVAPFFNTSTDNMGTTMAAGSTGQSGSPMPGSTPAPNPLLYGQCVDQIMDNGCSLLAPSVCKNDVGVQVCPQTCGLCDLLESQFHGKALCEDHLISNECEIFKVTKDICNNKLAKFTCPNTCNICETVLLDLVNQVLNGDVPTADPSATQMTDGAVTETATVAMTTAAMAQGTTESCVDTLQGMSCDALNGICSNPLAHTICRSFCGLCGDGASSAVNTVSIETVTAVVQG